VTSGIFTDNVAQTAIMPISDVGNTVQNVVPQPSVEGGDRIGPTPPALIRIHPSRAAHATVTSGAAQFSKRRSASMPRTITAIWITQNSAKDNHIVHGCPPKPPAFDQPLPASLPMITKIAWPPTQVWMPNQPH